MTHPHPEEVKGVVLQFRVITGFRYTDLLLPTPRSLLQGLALRVISLRQLPIRCQSSQRCVPAIALYVRNDRCGYLLSPTAVEGFLFLDRFPLSNDSRKVPRVPQTAKQSTCALRHTLAWCWDRRFASRRADFLLLISPSLRPLSQRRFYFLDLLLQ